MVESRRMQAVVILVAIGLFLGRAVAADEVFDARGFNPHRDTFSQLPFEHIDPVTGNLLLTFTDLALPGNAGFDLKIQRTYNSKIYRNYQTQGETLDEDSWAGVGWTLHFGRIANPEAAVPGPFEMPDGSQHKLFNHVDGSGRFITRDFWVYQKGTTPVLRHTNGLVYELTRSVTLGSTTYRYVTAIRDPYGNRIDITYKASPADAIDTVTQTLAGATPRTRTVTFQATGLGNSLNKMEYVDAASRRHTWTYVQDTQTGAVNFTRLTRVDPPIGPSWVYTYRTTSPKNVLSSVTSPHGATITYVYQEKSRYLGSTVLTRFIAVTSRTTGGRDVTADTWTYTYEQTGKTIITGPCAKSERTFYGIGDTSALPVWKIGLPKDTWTYDGATLLETESLTWKVMEKISSDGETVGVNHDNGIYVPLIEQRRVWRGTSQYTTDYTYNTTNFNDYGRAYLISASGELARTTTIAYKYFAAPLYLVDRIESETVSMNSVPYTKSYTYDASTGFKLSETVHGITTTFGYFDPLASRGGNVKTSTNARNYTWTYSYDWGVVDDIATPQYTINRSINSDGTVASETRRGFTTNFQYDLNFRLERKTPPSGYGNAWVMSYDNTSGTYSRVTRGASVITTYLDGFGRPSGMLDSENVRTEATYDACGRLSYESLPYDSTNVGVSFQHDALDRVTRRTYSDSTYVEYDYDVNGIDVAIYDENRHMSRQNWSAFGDPRDARLMSVTDARSKTTSYAYNTLGSLTLVDSPDNLPDRSWTYCSSSDPAPCKPGRLKSETHPESGTVTYGYDAVGNLASRNEPEYGQTCYKYDGNDRLLFIDRFWGGGTCAGASLGTDDVTFAYDESDNRTLARNQYVMSEFQFDGGNRLDWRRDTIDGHVFVTDYTPTQNDLINDITYPSSRQIVFGYDTAGRITSVTEEGGATLASAFDYHPSGAPNYFQLGNGLYQQFTYDNYRYWPRSIDAGQDAQGQTILSVDYDQYDDVGNATRIYDRNGGTQRTLTFSYDAVDRLETATGFWGSGTYTYDALGNRKSSSVGTGATSYSYQPGTLRLTAVGSESFTYYNDGSLATRPGASFAYTADKLLKTATTGSGTTNYRYDGDGMRVARYGPNGTSYFTHGPGGQILSEFDLSCSGQLRSVRDYVYAGTRLVAAFKPASVKVELVSGSASVAEGAGEVTASIRMTTSDGQPTECPLSVSYTTVALSATSGADYTPVSGAAPFAAGSGSGAVHVVHIPILEDALDEEVETFALDLTGAAGATIGATARMTAEITDNDGPPVANTADVGAVTELDTDFGVAVPVRLSAPSGKTVSVAYTTVAGTATEGADFAGASGVVTFAPGETIQTATITILGDVMDEPTEAFQVHLTDATNAALGTVDSAITLLDNDPPPAIDVANVVVGVTERSDGPVLAIFSVRPAVESAFEFSTAYVTADGSATAGSDYVPTAGRLAWLPGERTIRYVVLTVNPDGVAEGTETFELHLSDPQGATLGQAVGTVTIAEDGATSPKAGMVSPVPGSTLGGANATMPVTFTWSQAASGSYWLQVGTSPGADFTNVYNAPTSETSLTFDIPTDVNPLYVRLFTEVGPAWMTNDYSYRVDQLARVTVDDVEVTEGGEKGAQAVFHVRVGVPLDGGAPGTLGGVNHEVTVTYSTANGSALAGEDYVTQSGTLVFGPSRAAQTREVTIPIVGDSTPEGMETFLLNLTATTGGWIGDPEGVGTIIDDDLARRGGPVPVE